MANLSAQETQHVVAEVAKMITVCGCPVGYEVQYDPGGQFWKIVVELKVPNMWAPAANMTILNTGPDPSVGGPSLSSPTPTIQAMSMDEWAVVVEIPEHALIGLYEPKAIKAYILDYLVKQLEEFMASQIKVLGFS